MTARKMPPWFADPQYGHFSNDRSLKQSEIDTLVGWVDSGATMGNLNDAPPPVKWPDGWQITPDHVVTVPPYVVPAQGTIEWGYIVIPSGFTKDTWVTSIEVRPGVREAVHHVLVATKPHSPDIPYNVLFWDQKSRDAKGVAAGQPFPGGVAEKISSTGEVVKTRALDGANLTVFVPGGQPPNFHQYNAAKFIAANSDLVLQVHYTSIGRAVTEVTRIAFTIAKEEPRSRFATITAQPRSISDAKVFRIPAGAPNWASPPVEFVFNTDAELVWMMPHMHARGKDMTYRLTYPDGRSEIVLSVPRYDLNWQLGYDPATPIKVPKGTKLRVDAHFDNSTGNRANPDPTVDVYGGTQTWEEMMNPWLGVIVDRNFTGSIATTTAVQEGG